MPLWSASKSAVVTDVNGDIIADCNDDGKDFDLAFHHAQLIADMTAFCLDAATDRDIPGHDADLWNRANDLVRRIKGAP